jgi:tRNA threonylcarbamoyladenosine biosynthesis protein TsaE
VAAAAHRAAVPPAEARCLTEPELRAAGQALGEGLEPGEVVWLEGELGAGKTTLAQAIARGLGVRTPATSPTYGLVHRYDGRRGPVYHVDCYRLARPDDAADLDWQALGQGYALLVEWPDRAQAWVPPPTRRVRLAHAHDPALRWVSFTGPS